MSYTKLTDYASKDALLSGDPLKVIKGTDLGAEFDSLETNDAQNVKGPASSVDNQLARYDGITGKLIQTSAILVDDSANLSGIGTISSGAISTSGDVTLTGADKGVVFEGTTADAFETTLKAGEPTADRVITLPDATDTLVGKATADVLTNKTISLTTNTLAGTSAELAAAIGDETGSGALVFANTPTLVTPILGTPQSGTVTNLTGTASININGTVGATTPATGRFTTLESTGNATLGDAEATDTHAIKGATTLLANSASAALTVTQTGAGNAFVVEDSASTDSTPFVIDSTGRAIIGNTAYQAISGVGNFGFQLQGTGALANAGVFRFDNSATGPLIHLIKSRAAAPGTSTVVQSGDGIGEIAFRGADGTDYIIGASIAGAVDGTPGTNDMPGRLVFSTTADGASSPTERLRIDSTGNVGIGGSSPAGKLHTVLDTGYSLGAGWGPTTAVFGSAGSTGGALAITYSDASGASLVALSPAVAWRNITYNAASHIFQVSGTISALTLGTDGASTLTANSASAALTVTQTGAGNAFVVEDSASTDSTPFVIDSTGNVGIGGASPADRLFAYGAGQTVAAITDAGSRLSSILAASTGSAAGDGGVLSVGTAVTNGVRTQWAMKSLLTNGAANGTSDFVISGRASTADTFLTERMRIDSAGKVGIGAAASLSNLYLAKTVTGGASWGHVRVQGQVQSDVTAAAWGYQSISTTAAALTHYRHFFAEQSTLGGTLTNQIGLYVDPNMVGASTNYGVLVSDINSSAGGKTSFGVYSAVTSAANQWNFHAAGTAPNAYAGNSAFGKIAVGIASVDARSLATDLVTNAAGTYTVLTTDHTIIQTTTGSTYTLPAAGSFTGRMLHIVTQFAGAVISASSNVVPIAGGAAGTAILAATAGKFATLQSNGTNWIIIASN